MVSINQDIKDALATTGVTITNAQLQRVSDWLTIELGLDRIPIPRIATADDLMTYWFNDTKAKVLRFEDQKTLAAIKKATW